MAQATIRNRIKALRIVKASELKPHPKRWRTHTTEQRSALRGLLEEIGFADAVIVRELRGGTLQIINGHLVTEEAGDAKVPALVLDVTAAEAEKLLASLDPLAAMAGVDRDALTALLKEVAFQSDDVNKMLAELATQHNVAISPAEDPTVEDPTPLFDNPELLQKKWKTATGQVWEIPSKTGDGAHRIICGDSQQPATFAKLLGKRRADLCVTSPPYNVGIDYPGYNDTRSKADFLAFLLAVGKCVHDCLAPGRFIAWNIGVSPSTYPAWHVVKLEEAGFEFVREIVWLKVGTIQFAFYHSMRAKQARHYKPNYVHELIYLLSKPGGDGGTVPCPVCKTKGQVCRADLPMQDAHETLALMSKGKPELGGENNPSMKWANDVWRINQSGSGKDLPTVGVRSMPRNKQRQERTRPVRAHPAVFPITVAGAAIDLLTSAGELVLDPFCGTASTVVAAEKAGRLAAGVEQAPLYLAIALERLTNQGLKPQLVK